MIKYYEILQRYAYLSQPIIIKRAFFNWPAREQLTFQNIKEIYYKWPDALNRDICQFLPFKSTFASLNEFFNMSEVDNDKPCGPTYYLGFSNCHTEVLKELRKLYSRPHFLPESSEVPNTDYIFMGYDDGATFHVSVYQ